MNAKEIVKKYLKDNGFDGLVQPDAECGCGGDTFHDCDENFTECEPAYRVPVPTEHEDEYGRGGMWYSTKKPEAGL